LVDLVSEPLALITYLMKGCNLLSYELLHRTSSKHLVLEVFQSSRNDLILLI